MAPRLESGLHVLAMEDVGREYQHPRHALHCDGSLEAVADVRVGAVPGCPRGAGLRDVRIEYRQHLYVTIRIAKQVSRHLGTPAARAKHGHPDPRPFLKHPLFLPVRDP